MIKGVREAPDGTIWHPNPSRHVITQLDAEYDRMPGEFRWRPKGESRRSYDNLRFNETVYIVGCGPSIDNLTARSFEQDATILCINHSLQVIESLGLINKTYGIQMDCIFCHGESDHIVEYAARLRYPDAYVFSKNAIGSPLYTSEAATAIAVRCGAKRIIFYGMDAQFTGDLHYAQSVAAQYGTIEKTLNSNMQSYVLQAQRIKSIAKGCAVIFKSTLPVPADSRAGDAIIHHTCTGTGSVAPLMRALGKALQDKGYNITKQSKNPRIIAVWNGIRGMSRELISKYPDAKILILEHGFFNRGKYAQVDGKGFLHNASWATKTAKHPLYSPAERLSQFVNPKPVKSRKDGYILILGQMDGDSQLLQSDPSNMLDLVRLLIRYKRDYLFRPHPQSFSTPSGIKTQTYNGKTEYQKTKQGSDLAKALAGARYVVSINSNSLVEATVAGIPCLAFGPSVGILQKCYHKATTNTLEQDLLDMDNGWEPDPANVTKYLELLACNQWSAAELENPVVLDWILNAS